jgi:plasmid stability protein
MATLYLRNVPDEVSERLRALAAREGLSVGAFAVRELTEASRRADNRALLGELPDLEVKAETVVADIQAGRAGR